MSTVATEEEKWTYQDYVQFPDNGKRYQIIQGEVYMSPAPVPYHQRIIRKLGKIIDEFITRSNLGEVFYAPCDVVFSDENVVQPDIFFISTAKLSIITDKCIEGVPDLIIEITSPYTQKIDKLLKKRLYEIYRVQEYWIVDVDKKTLQIFSHTGKAYEEIGNYKVGDIVRSELLKDIAFSLTEIF
ncbi:MAG: Uma2 family endonuclease [Candidatus Hydrogenedentota bacterium]